MYCHGDNDVRVFSTEHMQALFQMRRCPQIIMSEIGDISALRSLTAEIVWTVLTAAIGRKIEPLNPGIREGSNDLLAIIRASVSDHEQLELLVRLHEHGLNRQPHRRAQVVRGKDDGDGLVATHRGSISGGTHRQAGARAWHHAALPTRARAYSMLRMRSLKMVGATGIEPVTPTVSR